MELNFLKELKYFFCYMHVEFRIDPKLKVMEIYLEEIGIKSIYISSTGNQRYTVIFNDDTEFEFWSSNRWYAFMHTGEANFSNGKSFKWDNAMPPRSVLFKYRKIIKEHEKNNRDYSEYLPIKLVRKYKLLKLK